jgi:hypothetical protein
VVVGKKKNETAVHGWRLYDGRHSCARQEVDTVSYGFIDDRSSNNLSRTLEHARCTQQWSSSWAATACMRACLADGPILHSSSISHCGATNWERTACQANPRHGSSSPLASLLEQIPPSAASSHVPRAGPILSCNKDRCIWMHAKLALCLFRWHTNERVYSDLASPFFVKK